MRLLVVEGNTEDMRDRRLGNGRADPSRAYADLLAGLEPAATVDICFPADAGAALPGGAALEGYDGVAITGSGLHVYDGGPAVTAQVELVRAVFASGTPLFGSCWGLQVATVAAGGTVRRNPKGREIGIARRVQLTRRGRFHPLYADKEPVFQAITIHLDEVGALPPAATVLAFNDHSAVQAAEIRAGAGVCWAVQYHPEFDLAEIAGLFRAYEDQLAAEGFARDAAEARAVVADFERLAADPADGPLRWRLALDAGVTDPAVRTRELRNWLDHLVRPTMAARGRG